MQRLQGAQSELCHPGRDGRRKATADCEYVREPAEGASVLASPIPRIISAYVPYVLAAEVYKCTDTEGEAATSDQLKCGLRPLVSGHMWAPFAMAMDDIGCIVRMRQSSVRVLLQCCSLLRNRRGAPLRRRSNVSKVLSNTSP